MISEDPFRIDLYRNRNTTYRVKGSCIIFSMIMSLTLTVLFTIALNFYMDNKCIQEFTDLNCLVLKPSSACSRLVECYDQCLFSVVV